jgi:hypothetical protein
MPRPLVLVAVALGSLAAGVGLSFGQGLSVEPIAPLFNSALPVVTLGALAALAAHRLWACAILGGVVGPLAMVGYYGAATVRGIGASTSSVLLWVGAGVVAGSLMGAAVWVMKQPRSSGPAPWVRGAAVGLWPGIALGEAAHGLLRIADTTPTAYWWTQAVVALVVLAVLAVRCLHSASERLVAVAVAALVAGSLFVVYGLR